MENSKLIDSHGWEYATSFYKPVHTQEMRGDKFRRKRFVRQLIYNKSS